MGYFELDIGQFSSFWSFFGRFSAFDEVVEVVNIDEDIFTRRHTMLMQTAEVAVTINKGRRALLRHL